MEDWPFYQNHKIYMQIINDGGIGNLKKILFFHSGYRYHTLSLLRKLFKVNNFNFIISNNLKSGFSKINIYSGFNLISSILSPRDYNIGRTLIIGSKGFISDYKIKHVPDFANFFLYYKKNLYYEGLELYKNNILDKSYLLKKTYKFKSEEQFFEIQEKIKKDAVKYIFASIAEKKYIDNYPLSCAVYDYICFLIIDKLGFFFDIPIPFFRTSILSIMIKILLF